ncbi:rod shape-determining protein MreC [Oxalobacteraceae bacterium R-40]|uniref:Cell shape-determining protein MreC n=1 Tax=Keguizhuia sedimenti TaxID=3064264 RepID=A0ABU1BJM1_9BURK|nr:rod shape-determining protein MreC [Oxalobacteraceae bacterium R-40]
MDYSPPPLFKQGASARAKVVVFALIAISLLIVDSRLRSLSAIRQFVGVVLYPLQTVALFPRDAAYAVGGYFSSLSRLQSENGALKREQIANAQLLQQGQMLQAENAYLRKLLGAGERLSATPVMAEILYDARDAFTRKIVVDRGSRHGVELGLPVIDDAGVVGQVTRVFPFTSEVSLLTDKDQAIPVQVVRSGLRSVAYGQGHVGSLDLRFMPANVDIKNGDILVTSGIDGVYPAGLAVAKVTQVESKSGDAFARIVCQPLAGINRNRQLLILLAEGNLPAAPVSNEIAGHSPDDTKAAVAAKRGVETVKHAPAAQANPAPAASPDSRVAAPVPSPAPLQAQPQAKAATVQPPAKAQTAPARVSSPPAPMTQAKTAQAPAAAVPVKPVVQNSQPPKDGNQPAGNDAKINEVKKTPVQAAPEPKGATP